MANKKSALHQGRGGVQVEKGEGKEYQNLSPTVYHKNNDLSTLKIINTPYKDTRTECAWCGKKYTPTKPEYAWGVCCSYTCCLRYDESNAQPPKGRGVVLLNPDTKADVIKFDSVKEASDFCGAEPSNIRNVCNGLAETSGGYAWRWQDEQPTTITEPTPEPKRTKYVTISVRLTEPTYNKLVDHVYGIGSNITNFLRELINKELYGKRSVMEYGEKTM